MPYVRWESRPQLRRPFLVGSFEGWNDAGEAASTAVRHLADKLGARRFATIDPEEFYDFTIARPQVRLDEGTTRRIEWPTPTFSAAGLSSAGRDVVLLTALEPALKWRTFAGQVVGLAQELGVEMVITLGALLADVPHTRPTRVMGTATDPDLVAELGFIRSRYEGPTGMVGVLHDACNAAGLKSASLWASTPHYLHQTPSPKAALALVHRTASLLGQWVDTTELEIATAAYERQVDEMVASEDEIAEYVRHLEADSPADDPTLPDIEIHPDRLVGEVERFLRDQ